jgi:hypothetical protein
MMNGCFCLQTLRAGEQERGYNGRSGTAGATYRDLPGEAEAILYPAVQCAPGVFLERHHFRAAFGKLLPDALGFCRCFAGDGERHGGIEPESGAAVEGVDFIAHQRKTDDLDAAGMPDDI